MDIADSSSESGLAESVTDDDQHIDDNSLVCNPTAGIDVQGDTSNSVAVIYPSIDDSFKTEWTDVFRIPLLLLTNQFRETLDSTGPIHTWRGVDWTILFRLQLQGAENNVGAYFGYNEQPYYLNENKLRVQFQLQIVDEDGSVVLEGTYKRQCVQMCCSCLTLSFLFPSCHCRQKFRIYFWRTTEAREGGQRLGVNISIRGVLAILSKSARRDVQSWQCTCSQRHGGCAGFHVTRASQAHTRGNLRTAGHPTALSFERKYRNGGTGESRCYVLFECSSSGKLLSILCLVQVMLI